MPLHEVINVLVGKFASRVKFLEVDQLGLSFRLAGREYSISRTDSFLVCEEIIEGDITESTSQSKWLTAILRGCVRDDAGNMVAK